MKNEEIKLLKEINGKLNNKDLEKIITKYEHNHKMQNIKSNNYNKRNRKRLNIQQNLRSAKKRKDYKKIAYYEELLNKYKERIT